MNLLGMVWQVTRSIPDEVAEWMDRWVVSQHAPEDVDGEAVCLRCQTLWPCETVGVTRERMDARRQ